MYVLFRSIVFFGAALICIQANAVTVPDSLKNVNTQACTQMAGKFDPLAPKDMKLIPKYCECVSDAYWKSVPQSEYDAMMSDMQSGNFNGSGMTAMQSKEQKRMQESQVYCSKQSN